MRSWSASFRERVERKRKEDRIRAYFMKKVESGLIVEIRTAPASPQPSFKIPFRGLLNRDSFRA